MTDLIYAPGQDSRDSTPGPEGGCSRKEEAPLLGEMGAIFLVFTLAGRDIYPLIQRINESGATVPFIVAIKGKTPLATLH